MTSISLCGKKVDTDSILPFVLLPFLLSVATISRIVTIIVMVGIVMGVLYVYSRPQQKNRSVFFFYWTLSSAVWMCLIVKCVAISAREKVLAILLIIYTTYFFIKTKRVADFELALGSSKGKEYCPMITSDSKYCHICQLEVNDRFFHSIWWNCCIFRPNYCYFLVGNVLALITILLCINLTLTAMCENQIVFDIVVIPKYCTNMYDEFLTSLYFVSCIYYLGYVVVITMVLIQTIVFIPKYTEPQWKRIRSVLNV